MVEKKATTKTAAKKTATKKATAAKTATAKKTSTAKKEVIYLTAENAGFRAGDVYQALAAAEQSLSLEEVASRQTLVLRMLSLVSDGSSKRVRLRKRTTR